MKFGGIYGVFPEIFISFQTAAVSAITRSARGVLAVAVKDATEAARQRPRTKSLAEVPEDKFSPENYRLLKLAFSRARQGLGAACGRGRGENLSGAGASAL